MDELIDNLDLVLGAVISSCENRYNLKRPRERFESLIEKRGIEEHPIKLVEDVYNWLQYLFDNSIGYNPDEVKDYAESLSSSLVGATL